MPPGLASRIASQTSAASSCSSRLRTAATPAAVTLRRGSSSAAAATGASASTIPRLALERVTPLLACTAARIVWPSGSTGARSITGAIATPAATNSACERSINAARGWTFPGFSADASSRQASAAHRPRVQAVEAGAKGGRGAKEGVKGTGLFGLYETHLRIFPLGSFTIP